MCYRSRIQEQSPKEGAAELEVVAPSISILAEPPVAVVDKNADHLGTRKVAEEYIIALLLHAAFFNFLPLISP